MGTWWRSPGFRVAFSFVIVAILALNMSPMALAQDATPPVPVETEEPAELVETPEPVGTVVPTDPAEAEVPGDEPADDPAVSRPLTPGKPIGGGDGGLKPVPSPGAGPGDGDGSDQDPGDQPGSGEDEETDQPDLVPAVFETIYADYEGCSSWGSSWGAGLYMTNADLGSPESVQVNFTDGTFLTVPRTNSTQTLATYRLSTDEGAGKTAVSITAEVDTANYPVGRFIGHVTNPCGGEMSATLTAVATDGGSVEGLSYDLIYVGSGPDRIEASGTFDAGGTVVFDALRYGGTYEVEVYGDRFETNRARFEAPPRGESEWAISVERLPETVTIVGTTSDGGSAEGAIVTIDDGAADGFSTMAIVADGTLDANNAFTADLLAGDYTITIDATAQGYDVSTVPFTVPAEGPVTVPLQLQAASVTINIESADPAIADTLPADATWTVTSVQNPALSMRDTFAAEDLALPATITVNNPVPVGSYLVEVDAGPDFEPYVTTIEVTADSAVQAFTITLVPAIEEPTTGFVIVVKFYCESMSAVAFVDFMELDDDAFDFLEEDCVNGPATFTFYLVGDGTDDYVQIDVDGIGVGLVELAPGTYEVIEEGTQASVTIEVVAGEATVIGVLNPLADGGDDDDVVDPSPAPEDDKDEDATPDVTKLPSTGTGASDNTGVLAMAAAAAAALAGAGALSLRKR